MEMSEALRCRSPSFSLFPRAPISSTEHPQNLMPISPKFSSNTRLSVTTAKKKSSIEGVSEELTAIASLNLDFAPSRRRVRSAFTEVHQQLDHFLFKAAPAGIKTEEWYERNSRGLEIFCKSWMPESGVPLKAALCFCHGYGSTCTFFFEGIAKRIAAFGYGVYAMDYPGFGLSDGLHGYIPDFDDLVNDVIEHYSKIKDRPEVSGLPRYIMGQSMGGAIALKVHLKEPNTWDGVILVAPMCKIAEGMLPPTAVLKVLSILSKVMPKAKLFPHKDISELTFREPRKRKVAGYNVISYDDPTRLKTGMELLSATQEIESQLHKVSAPLLILHGAADKVTDPLVSQFLYEKASSKDKTLKIYEGGYHGILEGEPDDRISAVHNDIISWLDSRC
ncbi:caffeoylshikimate esterase isoform X1 [Vigna radiata var. radiata]|uniref:Caffeoylshikimate esterase isoform X1 n=1 Tax=Vigna radiata var. radiata TaxID=3916 RepID=A0A1S3V1Y0_VIGRR|nr:caffeoylshikimate esterase isoform X1 [Vigna radiata var. radiata]XP_022641484.1 caffeoylshikimate esterase isoform X1 [Vigna radiata var. radiata]